MEQVFISLSKHDLQGLIAETFFECLKRMPQQSGPSIPDIKVNYLTREEARKRLGNISLVTLGEYTKSGKLKGYRIGRRVLYAPADVDAALTAINTGEVVK